MRRLSNRCAFDRLADDLRLADAARPGKLIEQKLLALVNVDLLANHVGHAALRRGTIHHTIHNIYRNDGCWGMRLMPERSPLHSVVALLQDQPTTHFESGEPLLLRRGQIGTLVMTYDDGACEVEFADRSGRAYAILTLSANQLMVLHDAPEHVSL
jgi:hypothetical protein